MDEEKRRLNLLIQGWMYGATGNRWSMQYELSKISWDAPRPLDTSCSDSVLRGLEYEIGQLDVSSAPVPGDFYYWGGALAAQSRLALIAYVFHVAVSCLNRLRLTRFDCF